MHRDVAEAGASEQQREESGDPAPPLRAGPEPAEHDARRLVRAAVEIQAGRHLADHHRATGTRHAGHLGDGDIGVGDVLDRPVRPTGVELAVGKRQRGRVAHEERGAELRADRVRRASAMRISLRSMPTAVPSAPTISATAPTSSPVPQPTSSTESPGPRARSASEARFASATHGTAWTAARNAHSSAGSELSSTLAKADPKEPLTRVSVDRAATRPA